ncbi:MAG TPA: Crp/Fnr family transcriptional regulator [Devosia sp.]|nr:Crp/Fnr family transcriptional regulator [Devosia sp.]
MTNPLIAKFERWDDLAPEEQEALNAITVRNRTYEAGADIVPQGSRPTTCCLLLEGYAARATYLTNGDRQIGAVHVPGDFVDIHSFVLKLMDHSVVAVTRCEVAIVPHATIRELCDRFPHLARLFWLNTAVDGAVHREWLAAMGRRTAEAHFAHLLCEMYLRLKDIGRVNGLTFPFPFTQVLMGDVLGLSAVHVNRTVQKLRGNGLIAWEGGTLEILDWDALVELADFDDTYLNRIREPR